MADTLPWTANTNPEAPADPAPAHAAPPEDAATSERLEDLFTEEGECP